MGDAPQREDFNLFVSFLIVTVDFSAVLRENKKGISPLCKSYPGPERVFNRGCAYVGTVEFPPNLID